MATHQPFFCSACGDELKGKGVQRKDGQWVCKKCDEKVRRAKQSRAQHDLFVEQSGLFENPSRTKRNVEMGFHDATGFHPIRASKDYNEFLAGDFDTDKHHARRQSKKKWAEDLAARQSAKEWEDFEKREARKAQRGAGTKRKEKSLAQFVRAKGGIAPGRGGMYAGELQRLGRRESGTTGLINQHARQGSHRQTAEYVMDAANVAGYRDKKGRQFSNIGDFIYALEEDATGSRKYFNFDDMNNPKSKPAVAKVVRKANRAAIPPPARFPAAGKPQKVQRLMRVRDLETGERGTVVSRQGRGGKSFLKVRWDNRDKHTLIKPDQLAIIINPKSKEKKRGRRFEFSLGAKVLTNPMHWLEIGSHSAMILSGVQTARQMLGEAKAKMIGEAKAKKKARKPTVHAAGKRLAERRHRKNSAKENPKTEALITPKLARRYLATNPSRKDMVWARVGAIAKKIKAGTYKAETPILFKNGKLIDGRHRLEAVIRAGKGARFPIERIWTTYRNAKPKAARAKANTVNSKPTPALQKLHEDFRGVPNSGKVMKLYTVPGTPLKVDALAPLIKIEMANGSEQKFAVGAAWLGGTQHGGTRGPVRRLRIGLRQPFPTPEGIANPARPINLGEVKRIWYKVAKPHLYPNLGVIKFHHTMGEEGGRRPHLIMQNGCLAFKGGDYEILREGISN